MANKSNNNITSEFLQGVIEDKKRLDETLKEVTKSSLSSIMEERVENSLRQILSESEEDEFVEDEVEDVEQSNDDEVETDEVETETDTEESGDDAEMWNDLEQYKDEDGEYDLTGMDTDSLMQVMSVMKPEDGVRVVKNDEGSITLTDDTTDKEYEITFDDDEIDVEVGDSEGDEEEFDIELDGEEEFDDTDDVEFDIELDSEDEDEDTDTEDEYEIEIDDDEEELEECGRKCRGGKCESRNAKRLDEPYTPPVNEGNVNLGYTDNFQNKTAMTTPSNDEPADSKSTYSMDKGVPTGTSKAWAGKETHKPYDEKVNEGEEILDENEHGGARVNSKKYARQGHGFGKRNRNISKKNGETGKTGKAPNSGVEESLRRKANAIFKENKELKALIPEMQKQLMECIVINKSMGNVMKLVTENTTTMSEKKEILGRFAKVKTLDESDQLYGVIKEELSRQGKAVMNNGIMNPQLAESRNHSVKEPMYQSEDLSKTINLMQRLEKMK